MKTLFFISLLFLCLNVVGQKNVTVDKNGNYVSTTVAKAETTNKLTGKYYIDSKGIKYPVYISSNSKLFYYKISSKTGNTYKVYLKTKK
jgi:hypothetical protein